jgi:hypothetical protein
MKASVDDAPTGRRSDEGWDETVLVWNGTVARIPASGIQPDSADPDAGQTVRLQFRATTDFTLPTSFRIDDVSLK